jgi:hypothetical protein
MAVLNRRNLLELLSQYCLFSLLRLAASLTLLIVLSLSLKLLLLQELLELLLNGGLVKVSARLVVAHEVRQRELRGGLQIGN